MSDIVDRLKSSVSYIEKWYTDIDMIARVDVSLRVNKELMVEAVKEIERLRGELEISGHVYDEVTAQSNDVCAERDKLQEIYGKCIICPNHGNDGKMVTMCLPCYEKLHSEVMRLRYEQELNLADVDRFRNMARGFDDKLAERTAELKKLRGKYAHVVRHTWRLLKRKVEPQRLTDVIECCKHHLLLLYGEKLQ
jgi:regulator of replication initiation timing